MEKNHLKGFLTFLLFAIFMAFSLGSYAQTKQISGQISDLDGGFIPGVSIAVKGTTMGTVTNLDGMYNLEVPATAKVLVYSYIGMLKQEIEIGDQTIINICLLYTSDAADDLLCVDLGGRRIIK